MHRFFEILPGALAWLTLVAMVVFSWLLPAAVAVFIILFDIYWLLRTIYLFLHLRATFRAMRGNLKANWVRRLEEFSRVGPPTPDVSVGPSELLNWKDIYHLVIFPMYMEPYEVVRESFASLAAAEYPKDKFLVVLAVEDRAGEAARGIAKKIEKEFGKTFFKFLITVHPAGLAGEIPGKGSNEAWAGVRAKEALIDPLRIPYEQVLVSVFDIDTQVFPGYFGRLTYVFLKSQNRLRAIYQPIPLFTNNIYRAPALARVISFSSTFWQMMQQSRPERLVSFSSQSVPLQVLLDVGFWHRDAVSEDSRIFWQGYLHYHGDFRCEPLAYPVSMDANAAPTFWQTMKNIYRQHRRHGWGVENITYIFSGFLKDPLIPMRKKWHWMFDQLEGYHSWATNSLLIFALGWLPLLLGGEIFQASLLSYNLPQITSFIVNLSMFGVATSAILGIALLPPKPEWFRSYHYLLYVLQWLLLPLTFIIFGSFPALEAQTRLMLGGRFRLGFWPTPKSREGVGEKR